MGLNLKKVIKTKDFHDIYPQGGYYIPQRSIGAFTRPPIPPERRREIQPAPLGLQRSLSEVKYALDRVRGHWDFSDHLPVTRAQSGGLAPIYGRRVKTLILTAGRSGQGLYQERLVKFPRWLYMCPIQFLMFGFGQGCDGLPTLAFYPASESEPDSFNDLLGVILPISPPSQD